MIEQNEFLDIILMCDTSRLRLPLREQPTNLLANPGQGPSPLGIRPIYGNINIHKISRPNTFDSYLR